MIGEITDVLSYCQNLNCSEVVSQGRSDILIVLVAETEFGDEIYHRVVQFSHWELVFSL